MRTRGIGAAGIEILLMEEPTTDFPLITWNGLPVCVCQIM